MQALIFLVVVFYILLFVWIKSNAKNISRNRGQRGEDKVSQVIGGTIENEQYVINNLILGKDDKTTQIDHIVINQRGIFVIETKNCSGKIYGFEEQREWTQYLSRGQEFKFYNPLKQNATHVYYIRKLVGRLPIHSYVVFVQNNTKNIIAKNVIPLSVLKSVLQYGEKVLSIQQMKLAYEILLSGKIDITVEEHVQNIKEQQDNLQKGFCPRCNGHLVLRKGKYGEFFGCSNYPNCKFIKRD